MSTEEEQRGSEESITNTGSTEDYRKSVLEIKQGDPVKQICDIEVKIADLGNACWVVCHVLKVQPQNFNLFCFGISGSPLH
jgi:hypothetical protein